jgi:bifunctional oligoribonuclease and PAP phosphatase NrnA
MENSFNNLISFLKAHSSFAVVCHLRPDGDAIGSLLALRRYLELIDKKVSAYCFDSVPDYLLFLPEIDKIKKEPDVFWQKADAIIFVDCGDKKIIGSESENIKTSEIAVIDHHLSNKGFGSVNVIDPKSSATSEVLYRFFKSQKFLIDKIIATFLFTGIYTDTDGFSNLGTTPGSLEASGELLAKGAIFKEITASTLRNKSISSLKLWGRALERLKVDRKKGIAVTVIKKEDLKQCQAKPSDMEGVANLLNHLSDVKMSIVLRELPDGTVKGSLRTTNDSVDVSKVAALLGGGGHSKASGFIVKGKIEETENGWKVVG